MNETFVTFQGWVGNEVVHRETPQGNVANLRVGSTPRIRKRSGEWVDGQTSWFSVTCWRGLADNVRDSIRKGDPVIVHGRLRTETWRPDEGPTTTTLHVEASLVGHDLTRGISHFIKRPERRSDEPVAPNTTTDGAADSTPPVAGDTAANPDAPGDHLAA
jgi:single-strand DNA-binding protein